MTQLSKWVKTLVGDQSVVFNAPWLRVEGQSIDTVCEGVRGSTRCDVLGAGSRLLEINKNYITLMIILIKINR